MTTAHTAEHNIARLLTPKTWLCQVPTVGPSRLSDASVSFLRTQQFQLFSEMRVPYHRLLSGLR